MRIGTWNLEGRWDERHLSLLEAMACDLLLLTEVREDVDLPGHQVHRTEERMAARRAWAAVASRDGLTPLPDPHAATATARWRGLVVASSILPWRGCGARPPWQGGDTGERTAHAVAGIEEVRPQVWGGDWNHALDGAERAGSRSGRHAIASAVARLGLAVPTTPLPHRSPGLLTIDHVAVPANWQVRSAERFVAEHHGVRISDHDAYVVEVAPHV